MLLVLVAALVVPAGAQDKPRGERQERKRPTAPKVGAVARRVKLLKLGTAETVNIADARGKRPVMLIFGSYT